MISIVKIDIPFSVSYLVFLRCSVFSFCPQASSTQDEKLVAGLSAFSRSTLASISSISSWGKRIFFFADLLLVLLLATFTPQGGYSYVRTLYSKKKNNVSVDMCAHIRTYCAHSIFLGYYKKQRLGVLGTTTEASNHNVKRTYTMATHHSTQTRPNFIWLFLAVRRSDVADKPRRHQITAPTYDAARRLVARDYVAAFAGRLPTGADVHHV